LFPENDYIFASLDGNGTVTWKMVMATGKMPCDHDNEGRRRNGPYAGHAMDAAAPGCGLVGVARPRSAKFFFFAVTAKVYLSVAPTIHDSKIVNSSSTNAQKLRLFLG